MKVGHLDVCPLIIRDILCLGWLLFSPPRRAATSPSSTLRRSHSQPKFVTAQTGFRTSHSTSQINESYRQEPKEFETSSLLPSAPVIASDRAFRINGLIIRLLPRH